jgi:molybdate transport system ATP-binding protein
MTLTPPTVAVDFHTTVGDFHVHAHFAVSTGITTLFGPSGAGKSLTLSTIAGLIRPTTGRIVLRDVAVADTTKNLHIPSQERRIGMVFQHGSLLPHRTPLDNVALAVRNPTSSERMSRAERRRIAQHWLDRVSGGHLSSANTSTLSGGEQQRVALARALAGEPHTLLLDEPFTALDHTTRHSLRELLRDVVEEHNISALVVTHDIDDIVHMAHHVVMFDIGATTGTHTLQGDVRQHIMSLIGLI